MFEFESFTQLYKMKSYKKYITDNGLFEFTAVVWGGGGIFWSICVQWQAACVIMLLFKTYLVGGS